MLDRLASRGTRISPGRSELECTSASVSTDPKPVLTLRGSSELLPELGRLSRRLIAGGTALITLLVLGAVFFVKPTWSVSVPFVLEAAEGGREIRLFEDTDLDRYYVRVGDTVRVGTALVELHSERITNLLDRLAESESKEHLGKVLASDQSRRLAHARSTVRADNAQIATAKERIGDRVTATRLALERATLELAAAKLSERQLEGLSSQGFVSKAAVQAKRDTVILRTLDVQAAEQAVHSDSLAALQELNDRNSRYAASAADLAGLETELLRARSESQTQSQNLRDGLTRAFGAWSKGSRGIVLMSEGTGVVTFTRRAGTYAPARSLILVTEPFKATYVVSAQLPASFVVRAAGPIVARLRFDAYPALRYGSITATLRDLERVTDQPNSYSVYLQPALPSGRTFHAGMTGTADIQAGRVPLWDYLISPRGR
jgi:multidrug efflux pump subunit AcrA (membrane-fusion protein)